MDAITDPSVRETWVMKSAQIGWTSILENVVGYHVHQDPAPMLLVQPTLEIAEAFSKDRLAPMVRDSPALHGRIADAKSRDSGNTLLHKSFPGGHVTLAGANSPSGLASRPIRVVLFDEVDRYPRSAGTEGNPISLGRKRSTAFWNRRIAGGSTPTIKGASEIEARFDSSDQRFYFVPCPHCREFQRLTWDRVQWPDGKPEAARYACVACGVLWNDGERLAAIGEGEWRASKPFNGIAGFHINEIYSPFVRLEEMARTFLEAKKLPDTLQTFINTSLAETWEEQGTTVEPEGLLARRETYGPENIPAEALLLTAGVDVQDDRVEIQTNAWGADEENWVVEQHVIRGDPGSAELWLEVDEHLKRRFNLEDGRELAIEAAAVDSGGHHTQAVYQFVVSRKRRRVWAVKGMAGSGRLAWPKQASRTAKSRAKVFIVGVDTIKSILYGRLMKINEHGPGYIHLPASVDAGFVAQMTSEKAMTKYVRGRPTIVWQPRASGAPQEAQDCWLYAYAAMLGRGGPKLLERLAKRAGRTSMRRAEPPADEATQVSQPAPPAAPVRAPKAPRTTGGGWMGARKGWMKR